MGLVEAKMKILEVLWTVGTPMKSRDVAQKLGLGIAATTMHLLGLRRGGQVYTPRHGLYAITELGKETIGLPKIDKQQAAKILSQVPVDKAFHFYSGMHQYTHVVAHNLTEFVDSLEKIDVKSVEFHLLRKDFENWIQGLGDVELARRLCLIRSSSVQGEDLRTRVYEAARHRLQELIHLREKQTNRVIQSLG